MRWKPAETTHHRTPRKIDGLAKPRPMGLKREFEGFDALKRRQNPQKLYPPLAHRHPVEGYLIPTSLWECVFSCQHLSLVR